VKSVAVSPGDSVAEAAELFALDDAPLRIQEASLRADVSRHRAEAERARGEGRMAEMRVAQAQEQQSAADLEFIRHQLAGAVRRAPFAGVVIDDAEMRERLGAPVKRGDLLMKLARGERLYAELNVPERDIDEIRRRATGEIAFASRPELSLPIRIERIEPVAITREGGGVFLVRAEFAGSMPDWARPGMTGLAKIEAGRRTWFWIATHRLVDWLRLKLWW
jgi:multidrug resistance efflux pump